MKLARGWRSAAARDFMRVMRNPLRVLSTVMLLISCATRAPSPAITATNANPATSSAPPGSGYPAAAVPDVFPGAGTPLSLPSDISFVSLEGPYWVAAGNYLLFSDVVEANGPGAHIYKFDPASRRFSILPYPGDAGAGPTSTNGLAADPSGSLLACERYNARVIRIEPDAKRPAGRLKILADGWPPRSGLPFNAPNDLVVRHDGTIYFTDSDWGARTGAAHAAMGIYRLSAAGNLDRVADMEKPNGIALSPDGATLYVGSDVQGKVWKLPVDASGALGPQTLLIDGARVPGGFKIPDGICIDDAGNLYVANNSDDVNAIVVFDNAGRLLGRIHLPVAPSNCTFGGIDRRTMYVTTLHAIYEVAMPIAGLP